MQLDDAAQPVGQRGAGMQIVEPYVQLGPCLGRDDVGGSVADIDRGHLQAGWFELRGALIQPRARKLAQSRDERMHGIIRAVRVGHMALRAEHFYRCVQAAAPPDLDHLAQKAGICRLAHQTKIRDLTVFRHPLQDTDGAVQGRPLLVAGDQQADRAARRPRLQMGGGGGGKGGDRTLHVAGAAPIENAVFDHPRKWFVRPGAAGGHHVGMAGKAEMRAFSADTGEEIIGCAESQAGHRKT